MNAISILHLSDLHYASPDSRYQDDDKEDVNQAVRQSAFRNLRSLLEDCFTPQEFACVAIAGDITTHGKLEGFESFRRDTAPLLGPLVSDPRALCAVPGNHDVTWNLLSTLPDYFDQKFAGFSQCISAIGATTALLPTRSFPSDPDDGLTFQADAPEPLWIDDSKRLMVLCLNSSMRCGEVNEKRRKLLSDPVQNTLQQIRGNLTHLKKDSDERLAADTQIAQLENALARIEARTVFDIAHITQTQLVRLRRLLNGKRQKMEHEWGTYTKVALLHHHLVPFDYQMPEYKAFELAVDSSSVLSLLGGFGFQVVLTGHKHQPYIQRVQSEDAELLVVGGATVGGYAVPGYLQAVRHVQIAKSDGVVQVRVADLPCVWRGDLVKEVRRTIDSATPQLLHEGPSRRRAVLPGAIESALDDQLYARGFYKSNVVFDVSVVESESGLVFTTQLSYDVTNRTDEEKEWRLEYKFDQARGVILDARFNSQIFDPNQLDFRGGRGIGIGVPMQPRTQGRALIRAEEFWPSEGFTLYTSYHPTTDLRLILLPSKAPNTSFDFDLLYFGHAWPIKKGESIEVHLDRGLLPFQGIRLCWNKRKGATHE